MGSSQPSTHGLAPQLEPALLGASPSPEQRGRIGTNQHEDVSETNPRGILSRHQFVKQIRLEKRRTDRFKVPLSVLLFQVHPDHRSRPGQFGALVDLLRNSKRETDLIGYLDDGVVGVLLIHTGETGLQSFASKLATAAHDLTYTSTSGTYPDQVFERIIATDAVEPDTLPYFIDYDTEHGAIQLFLKRSMDIIGALVLLLLAAPIMLAAAIAIKVTSPGPVIFTQMRLGRKGVPFRFHKFRSMTTGADEHVHRAYVTRLIEGKHDEINQGDSEKPIYKLQGDSRVTRVGFFLRKTSIDELPQLFNVLKGDLSLVGPRPPIPYEAELYQSWHLRRILEGRPGITGLWQVEGRNRVSFDEMVRMDLRYTRTWTLWLDLKILVKTVGAVLRFDGEK